MRDPFVYRQVAQLHIACIDRGFLSTLGPGFLALMYQAIDETEGAVLLVETDDTGRVTGFVTGGTGMGAIYRRMLRRWPRLIATLAPSLINPRKVKRILEILRHSRGGDAPAGLPDHELLSIAVSRDARRGGVAARLYRGLSDRFAAMGADGFRIVVGESLGPAHAFYRRMGAEPAAEISVHDGASSTVYVQRIERNSPPSRA